MGSFARVACFLIFGVFSCALPCRGAFIGPEWGRPTDDLQALAGRSTYQSWNSFSGASAGNAPDVGEVNPNGVADAYDAGAPASGSFVTGSGNIYSPAGVIKPRAVVPSFGDADAVTEFLVQVATFGSEIDTGDLRVNGVPASTLPGYSWRELSRVIVGGGGPGSGAMVEHAWTFVAPEAASFQLDFGWGVTSASLDRISIDTRTSPAPEPGGALVLITAGAVTVARRRRRRSPQ
jgi:hypothetical protein